MIYCFTNAKYVMLADVVYQTSAQNEANQMSRYWDYDFPKIIECNARGILGGGIRVVGSTERFGEEYEDVEWVKLRTKLPYSDRVRITNIRKPSGEVIWKTIDEEGESFPVVFDVLGATPVIEPFGDVVEYELLLKGVQDV